MPLDDDISKPKDPSSISDSERDGRNKEWEDRARVNLEEPSQKSTNLERDFEPEIIKKEDDKEQHPAY